MKILFINRYKSILFGIREPELYGNRSYAGLDAFIAGKCRQRQTEFKAFQSNHKSAKIDRIRAAYRVSDTVAINTAAMDYWCGKEAV